VTQTSYAFTATPYDDFVIMRLNVKNVGSSSITNLYCGLYIDWDIISYAQNAGGWNSVDEFIWTAYNNGSTLLNYRGVKIVQGSAGTAYTARGPATVYYPPTGNGFTESEKFASLTNGFTTASTYSTAQEDLVQVIAVGPLSLAVGESEPIAFAMLAGLTQSDITEAATQAQFLMDSIVSSCCTNRGNVDDIIGPGGPIDVADLTYLVAFLFQGGTEPPCIEQGNIDGINGPGGPIDVGDLTYLVASLFQGGPSPPPC
jgi:hypothetical protein